MNKDGTKLMSEFYSEDSHKRLRSYFGHVETGETEDFRTPMFDGKPRDEVLNAWQQTLDSKLKGMEGLLKFENDLRAKVGPLSVMKPLKERMDDIDDYYSSIHLKSEPMPTEVLDALVKDWRRNIGGLRIKSDPATWEDMKKSTSSGSPFFQRRMSAYPKTVPFSLDDAKQYLAKGTWRYCATLGWRGQEGGPDDSDVKQRVIWMFPMAVNIRELSLYQPLIAACQRFNLVPAWNGNDAVDEEVTQLFDTKGKDDYVICTDFTKFDQHFNSVCQDFAIQALDALVTHDAKWTEWKNVVYPIKFNIPLMYDWGQLKTGEHGMASGSGGTNADETLFHRGLQLGAAITCGAELNRHSMCLGDDGLLSYPGIDLDGVLSFYTKRGQEMNESKQEVSKTEATYLRRWYSIDYRINGTCRGVYSTYRALGKLMGQERFYDPKLWGPEMVVMRALSIIENCKWHPAKEEFLEYCVKGDKYRLGLDIPGFFEKLEHLYESNELAQSFKSYTAGDKVGINSWWVVNALKAMR